MLRPELALNLFGINPFRAVKRLNQVGLVCVLLAVLAAYYG